MNFDFEEISSAVSTSKKQLKGDTIHEVKFDGCEYREIQASDGRSWKVFEIKFSNDEGVFSDITWGEPSAEETESAFGKNPSARTCFQMKILHLLDAVNPEFAKKMRLPADNPNRTTIKATSWEGLCKQIEEITKVGIGTTTKIKLLSRTKTNSQGEKEEIASFPGFIAGYSREGRLYLKNRFIGNTAAFTPKELENIQKKQTATPTPVKDEVGTSSDFDLNLDI